MKNSFVLVGRAMLHGLLVIVPIYLAILLLLKGMKSLMGLVKPVALLLPDWFPGEMALSFLLVLIICGLVGAAVRTRTGRMVRERLEKGFFERIPGYALFRSLTHQVAGQGRENTWKPALAEIEEALVPAFIIEKLDDGRYTVFVPSIPTPFAGNVYVLEGKRVHPVDVPFTQALQVISRWGSGAKELVAAMEREASSSPEYFQKLKRAVA
jgi:uncharacterized membrane protein